MIADAITEVAEEMRNRTARMKALTPSQKAVKNSPESVRGAFLGH